MPIMYSDHRTDPSSWDIPSSLAIPDADSSIVLSDLVRSGESSRLRRRGAVRLDHSHNAQPLTNSRSRAPEEAHSRLYCRECDTPSARHSSTVSPSIPYRPSLFPLLSQSTNSERKGQSYSSQIQERTLIHTRVVAQRLPHIDVSLHVHPPSSSTYPPTSAQVFAFLARAQRHSDSYSAGDTDTRDPDTENGVMVWTAVSDAVEGVVVPMHYDDELTQTSDTRVENSSRSMDIEELARRRPGPISTACMCKREVVACAVCGSTLGMRYTPCSSAMKKIFPTAHVPSPPPTHVAPNSNLALSSHLRSVSNSTNAEATAYRSRVADYLLAMSTPRSTRTTPSPPDTIHVTPETHNTFDRERSFEVSILPRSTQGRNTITDDASRPSRDVENEHGPNRSVRLTGNARASSDTDSDTEDESFSTENENDDHYRLPMITQGNFNDPDSSALSGHWTQHRSTRYVYRFFAEAVISEQGSKTPTPFRTATGTFSSSAADWHRLYANVYGLGQGNAGRRLSCG